MPRLTSLLADWAELNASGSASETRAYADTLLRACEPLDHEALRSLPGTPEDAATALLNSPFGGAAEGVYLPWEWFESFCSALRLPVAELESGWDISDADDVYLCPRVLLADDPDSLDDTRAFVRVDGIRRWPAR